MARLNMMKMIGLVVLLAIALTLPTVLPKAENSQNNHVLETDAKAQQQDVV